MKKFKSVIRRMTFLLILVAVALAFTLTLINKNREILKKEPVAKAGVLDLRNWDLKKQGVVKLNGQWEFYYNKLLTPQDFKNEKDIIKTGLINIPGSFKNYKWEDKSLNAQGYATYRLKVLTNNPEDLYAIKTEFIQTAHKIWVNDKVVIECGKVGKSISETNPKLATSLGSFYNDTNEFEIILQTSNFNYGVPQIDSILLGNEAELSENRAKNVGFDFFIFGITLAAGIYNFILFIRRKKDKAPLYFSIVCVLVCLRTILVGERLIYWVFPNMDYTINVKLLLWTFFLYIPVLIIFMNSFYTDLISKRILKISNISGIVYFFVILVLPPLYYTNLILPVEIISDCLLLYILSKMIYSQVIKKANYELVIIAILILFTTRINDILYEYSVIDTASYAPMGMLIFIFVQFYVLADRFSRNFSKVEEITDKLKFADKLKEKCHYKQNCNKKLKDHKNGRKILIVDDEAENVKILEHFLSDEQYTIVTASSGNEALNLDYNNEEIDLVILDMMLPDMLGWEICSTLREKYSLLELPILITTSDHSTESLVVSFESGVNDYLRKPFQKSELLARVKTLIDLKYSIKEVLKLQGKVASTTKQVQELNEDFEENKKMLFQIVENDKLRTEFFANMSHELRTPLNVIWSTIQLFQAININKFTKDYDINKYLNIMGQNTLRLLRLINNLIDTTKVEGGYLSIQLVNGNIISVIEEIALSTVSYIEAQGLELIFDTEVEEKYMAFDEDKIERIVLNLISNAIKFTEKGGSIFVNIYDLGDKIQLSIKDTGIGIPKDKLDAIFDRFSQVDMSLSRKSQGSGIGLALVKSLVEVQKGNVYAKSILGQGSEFIIELPVITVKESNTLKEEVYPKTQDFSKYVERIKIEFSDIYHD
jgi:signal transduction histidine kinase